MDGRESEGSESRLRVDVVASAFRIGTRRHSPSLLFKLYTQSLQTQLHTSVGGGSDLQLWN